MTPNLTLFAVNAILILKMDEPERIYAKYYSSPHIQKAADRGVKLTPLEQLGLNPYPSLKEQRAFEKGLHKKTAKNHCDIILYDNHLVLFKAEKDVLIYLVGHIDENEVLLDTVITCLRDALNILLRNGIDQQSILENYDMVVLAIDELIDDGIILQVDPNALAARVSKPPASDTPSVKGIDLSEQGLLNAWEFAKMKAQEKLRQGI